MSALTVMPVEVTPVSWPELLKLSWLVSGVVLVGSVGERPSTRVCMVQLLLLSLTK